MKDVVMRPFRKQRFLVSLAMICLAMAASSPLTAQEPALKTKLNRFAVISPDGKLLASPTGDIYDVQTGEVKRTLEKVENKPVKRLMAFSPDGKVLATGGTGHAVKLWDLGTGKLKATLEGHTGRVTCVAFSGDGKLVASCSYDRKVKLWNVGEGKEKSTLEGHNDRVAYVAFGGEDKLLASATNQETIVWELAPKQK